MPINQSTIEFHGIKRKRLLASSAVLLLGFGVATLGVVAVSTDANAGEVCEVFTGWNGSASATGIDAFACGLNASAAGTESLAVGKIANASNGWATALGTNARAAGQNSTAVGKNANASQYNTTAIGKDANASNQRATAVGKNANAAGIASTAIGEGSTANLEGTAIGQSAYAFDAATSLGQEASAIGFGSTAIGKDANAAGVSSTAVGNQASAGHLRSAAFGAGATTDRDYQMVFGTSENTYTMRGLTSDASRAAQSGPLEMVTTDAAGNLASDGGALTNRLDDQNRRLDEQRDGIAIALAVVNPDLKGSEKFGVALNMGYFDSSTAMGATALGVVDPDFFGTRLTVGAGVGYGFRENEWGGRVGVQFAW